LVFFSNEFIANEVMGWWELDPIPFSSIDKTYDVGIILTGVTSNDKLPEDRVYFSHGADRVTHTVDLYKRGVIKRVLVSGGSGRLVTTARQEAGEIRKALIMMGVPDSVISLEAESRNTHESAVNVRQYLNHNDKEILLITSSFHMRRSIACFQNERIEAEAFPVDFYTHPRYFTLDVLIIPKVGAIEVWHRLIKEWVGMLAYKTAGYI
jgi:uncharacterized SAM-binding protein YcdF (DUF218 family)